MRAGASRPMTNGGCVGPWILLVRDRDHIRLSEFLIHRARILIARSRVQLRHNVAAQFFTMRVRARARGGGVNFLRCEKGGPRDS